MHLNKIFLAALIAVTTLTACRTSAGKEDGIQANQTSSSQEQQASARAISRTGHNSMFYCHTPIPDLIEYNYDSCNVSIIRKPVDFGKGLGDGELIINFEDDGPHFIVKLKGREVLNEPRGNAESTLAAYDFDGDGRKEVFYQNGDEFSLTVFGFKGRELEELGYVTCNSGIIITDDGLCASRYGSQGLCDMFRIRDGKMEISQDEDIDPLLFLSNDFRNLRYSFEDTSKEDRLPNPMFDADIYIMPESSYGNHALNVDLDKDGRPEQLYTGEDASGNIYIRLIIPGTRTSYSLLDFMDSTDTVAFRPDCYDIRLQDKVQLSAKDTDGDGVLEVIVTAGSREKNSNYVLKYSRDKGPKRIKRYVQN